MIKAGIRGEERLLQKLSSLEQEFIILPNVCLEFGEEKVQIDCLLLSKKCIIVLESKNISGDLYIDSDTDEFYRLNNDQSKKYFPNPYYQLTKHIRFMLNWTKQQDCSIPVSGAVVFTSKNVTLRNNPFHYPFNKLDSVFERVHRLSPTANHLSDQELSSIEMNIHLSHRPFQRQNSLLEQYEINHADIIKGIVCPSCKVYSLIRDKYYWQCGHCCYKSRTGLQQAIEEYFTLVKPTITNQEFRDFFGVKSMKTATNMLTNLDLKASGSKRNRIYMRKQM
ncbi:nuclease-related domain-containing protein [Chungangia koreensis]|uniref:Nuclease-related domain-containing protein n=1 Tax=Chungangia koreensis TaxID=752657 RepID=A0ABV8XCG3_9LACT